ncbi:MAG TPA: zinc metallopeptidase [Flavilitoribacter sp.]|nr:zinc metallopeptidase [Flavilitoribacter sp.]
MGYIVIVLVFSVIGGIISNRLKSKFNFYSRVPLRNGMSGREVAEDMLRFYGIRDVKVIEGQGFLTDHYNPANKTVTLSSDVYHGRHIASAAVAAHECGHAVQHAQAYTWLRLRSAMVPVVSFAARAQQFILMFGIGLFFVNSNPTILLVVAGVFGVTALFSLVTLPVEFDASNRGLAWLNRSGVTSGQEYEGAKDALWWAAMTYVAAALSALAVFLYFVMQYLGSRD